VQTDGSALALWIHEGLQIENTQYVLLITNTLYLPDSDRLSDYRERRLTQAPWNATTFFWNGLEEPSGLEFLRGAKILWMTTRQTTTKKQIAPAVQKTNPLCSLHHPVEKGGHLKHQILSDVCDRVRPMMLSKLFARCCLKNLF
jgi:hypothetical protein